MFQRFFHDLAGKSENTKPSRACSETTRSQYSCNGLYWIPEYLSEDRYRDEYNLEWKKYLLTKNAEEIKRSSSLKERFTFYTPKIVKCVFNTCKMLGQPPEVRYLAVDILDRFLAEHFTRVSETFEEMEEENIDTWHATIERILNQSTLRILTSIQLAMKYSWCNNVILATEIQTLMERLGETEIYPKRSILKSEARIYQHLNFNISGKTPLTYIEMFFEDFQNRKLFDKKIALNCFFVTCIHVLDIAMVYHQKIYKTEGNRPVLKVLAAAVIFTSCILKEPQKSNLILELVSFIGDCKQTDVEAVGNRLFRVILDN